MRALILLSSMFVLVNCSALKAAARGDVSGAAQAAGGDLAAKKDAFAKAVADTKTMCKPLHDRIGDIDGTDAEKAKALEDAKAKGYGVAWNEERQIGGAIAIGFGRSGKGLYIDITDKDPVPLQAKGAKDRKSVKLSPGDKNDLNMYVQLVGDLVAAGSTRPGIAWTFGVIENDTANAISTPGGYVLITTGLLQLMDNEAQLAAVLGHEIGHVTGRHAIKSYANAKAASCTVAVGGLNMANAGLSDFPPAQDFVKNSKFGETMKAFAESDVDMDKNPKVDKDFMQWFTNRIIDFQNLTGNAKEDELDADRTAFELMAAAGYDTKELDKIISKLPGQFALVQHHPSNDARIEAIKKIRDEGAFGSEGGKAPAFPKDVKWPPKPAS